MNARYAVSTLFGLLSALGTVLVLGGCSAASSPGQGAPTNPSEGAVDRQPKVNRVVLGIEPLARETFESRNVYPPGSWYVRPPYEYLIGVNPESGKFVLQLATDWNVEPDGQSIRMQLRKGVRFHGDWGEFTSRDIAPVREEMIKEDSLHGNPPYWRSVVKTIETPSDYEVIFRLTRPDGNFYSSVGEAESGMEISSSKELREKGPATMQTGPLAGTGPYQFKGYVSGQYLRFERAPYKHWRATPDFPEFEFRFMKEASTRMAALLAGEIHIANLPQDLQAQVEKQGMKTVVGKVQALRNFLEFQGVFLKDPKDPLQGYMYPNSPLMDIRVRHALNIGFDRKVINQAFFGGKGQPMMQNHFNPSRPGWNPEWLKPYDIVYGYNLDKAKSLLAEAGYGPNTPLKMNLLVIPNALFSGAEDVTEAVAGAWQKLGVSTTLIPITTNDFSTGTRVRKFDNHIVIMATNSNLLLGSSVYNSSGVYGTGGGGGSGMHDPEIDKMVRDLWYTLDEKAQAQAARKLGDTLFAGYRDIPLFWLPAEMTVNPKVVTDWVFPGSIFGTWGRFENIKAAR